MNALALANETQHWHVQSNVFCRQTRDSLDTPEGPKWRVWAKQKHRRMSGGSLQSSALCFAALEQAVWLWRQWVDDTLEELQGPLYNCSAASFGIARQTRVSLFPKGCWRIEDALKWDGKPVNNFQVMEETGVASVREQTGRECWKEIRLWDLRVHCPLLITEELFSLK